MNCFARRWADLYMLWLFLLEGIFEQSVRLGFVEIFWCHCYLQCQICFGIGDGQDTEGSSNFGVSLKCSHYFYTKVCSQITSGGDLSHVETSKLISGTNRSTGPSVIQFLLEGFSETMLHHRLGNVLYIKRLHQLDTYI